MLAQLGSVDCHARRNENYGESSADCFGDFADCPDDCYSTRHVLVTIVRAEVGAEAKGDAVIVVGEEEVAADSRDSKMLSF